MSNSDYNSMKVSELKALYAQRCSYIGVSNPHIPRKKKDLVTMLQFADSMGIPKDDKTDPDDSIRQAITGILERGIEAGKESDRSRPVLFTS